MPSQLIQAQGVTALGISSREALLEPMSTLGRAPMGEGFRYDVALGTPLEAIIAECACRI